MSDEQKIKQLTEENKRLKIENDKLKSQLAAVQKGNKDNNITQEIKELSEQLQNIETKIDDMRNINSGILYLSTLNELREKEEELLETRRELTARITELEKKIEDKTVQNIEQPQVAEQKEEEQVEQLTEVIEEPIEQEVKEETLEETPAQEEKQEIVEETIDEEGIKVIDRATVDDLILANATRAMKNVPDDLVFDEEEQEEKSAFDANAQAPEEVQGPLSPSNEIEEVSQEEVAQAKPQAVVATEEFKKEETTNVEQEEEASNVVSFVQYKDANIKAVKSFVASAKNLVANFQSNKEAELLSMPNNMKESFDNNIIVMPEVIQFEEGKRSRAA